MTRLLAFAAALLASAALLPACSQSASPSSERRVCSALTGIDAARLIKIMRSMDLEAEEATYDGSAAVRWNLHGSRSTILVLSEGESLQFYVALIGSGATRDFVHDWNKSWRYSRSYLDGDGDPVLELDLDLAGGVCEERLKDWLTTCTVAFDKWVELMPEAGAGTPSQTVKPPAAPQPSFPFPPVGSPGTGT
ncbi:MAG: YbjN domain-containing protein [Deltaproteobacteria bacterium]|jgi:hypothetical protein|nr:YbjN domain-containing protein [Deltaproteobacteria bacterium]